MLVNTTSKELQLDTGLVSALLLKKAGPHIQTDCSNARSNGVDFGDICPTTAGSLPCKYIYHGALPPFKGANDNNEKVFLRTYTAQYVVNTGISMVHLSYGASVSHIFLYA